MKEEYSKIILKRRALSERSITEVLKDKKFVKIEDIERSVVTMGGYYSFKNDFFFFFFL